MPQLLQMWAVFGFCSASLPPYNTHHDCIFYLGRMNLCSRKDKICVLCKAILRWEDNVDGVQGTICALTPSSSHPPRPQVGCLPASLHRACGSENGNGEAENGNDEISDLPLATTDCPPRLLIRRLRGETSIFITHPLPHSPTHPLTKTDRFQCILGPIYRCEDGFGRPRNSNFCFESFTVYRI